MMTGDRRSPEPRRAEPSAPGGNILPGGSTGFASTTSGRWTRDDASPVPVRTAPLVAPHPPGRPPPTATGATVRADVFVPGVSPRATRAVPSAGLDREWSRSSRQPRTGQVLMCRRPLVYAVVADRLQGRVGVVVGRWAVQSRSCAPTGYDRRVSMSAGSGPGSPGLIFALGVPSSTTPRRLILAVVWVGIPLDPALKDGACARNSRQSPPRMTCSVIAAGSSTSSASASVRYPSSIATARTDLPSLRACFATFEALS